MIVLIDNYDSFSYNVYQLIGSVKPDIKVVRNDEVTIEELEAMKKEPAYGRPIHYFMSDGCTSGPTMADHLGY